MHNLLCISSFLHQPYSMWISVCSAVSVPGNTSSKMPHGIIHIHGKGSTHCNYSHHTHAHTGSQQFLGWHAPVCRDKTTKREKYPSKQYCSKDSFLPLKNCNLPPSIQCYFHLCMQAFNLYMSKNMCREGCELTAFAAQRPRLRENCVHHPGRIRFLILWDLQRSRTRKGGAGTVLFYHPSVCFFLIWDILCSQRHSLLIKKEKNNLAS